MKNTVMSIKQIGEELFDPTMQTLCLKSSDPNLRLRYLEAVINYNNAENLPRLFDSLARDILSGLKRKQ